VGALIIRRAPGLPAIRAGVEEAHALLGKGVVANRRQQVAVQRFSYLDFPAACAGVASTSPGLPMVVAVNQRRVIRPGPNIDRKDETTRMGAARKLDSAAGTSHEIGA